MEWNKKKVVPLPWKPQSRAMQCFPLSHQIAYRARERLVFTKTITNLSQSCVVSQESETGRPVTHPEDVTHCYTPA
jgi:hypothetical protein